MRQTIPMLILMILWTVTGTMAQPQHGGEKPRSRHDGGHGPGVPGGLAPFGPGGPAPGGPAPFGPGGPGGARQSVTGSAVEVFSGSKASCALPSLQVQATTTNESAVHVKNGAICSVAQVAIQKTGNTSSEESSNFNGLNAAIGVWKGSKMTIDGGNIQTNGDGANAIFAWGPDAQVEVSKVLIRTTANSSRGLDATYGGTIKGRNLTIETKGAHCANLATDRGGGHVHVENVRGTTAGDGSPGIYSTGDIRAVNSRFEAFDSEAAVIEGKNTIHVTNCELIGHRLCGAMLYQSFSGDAEVGTSLFNMNGGSLDARKGPVFFVTNTKAVVKVKNATLRSADSVLAKAAVARWGRSGMNGGHLVLSAEEQQLNGSVEVDDISSITLNLEHGAVFNGSTNATGGAGKVNLMLADGSRWNVTGTSYIDQIACPEANLNTLVQRIQSNGHTIYYRKTQGALDGRTFKLPDGGKLVYAEAPQAKIPATVEQMHHQPPRPPRP